MTKAAWESTTWGDVVELRYGKALRDYRETGGSVTVYGTNGPVGFTAVPQAKGPGVVVGRKGAYRGVHYSPDDYWVIDTAFYIAPKRPLDMRWTYYALQLADINGLDSGSAIPSTTRESFAGLRATVPPLAEQQAIAEVLGALDDKIAANTTLAERADELMHQTFRSLAKAIETPLSATADFVNGKAFTKGASGTGRVVVRIAELNAGIGSSTVYSDATVEDKHAARPGDILFAWSGSLTLHRWFGDEAIVNQHIFKVVPHDRYPAWLIYELIRQKLADFKAIAADKATTMGHIQRHHLDELVRLPSMADLDRLAPLMSALWDASLNAERESLTLAMTRDALLPQLMSGKLRVRDAERIAAEAGA